MKYTIRLGDSTTHGGKILEVFLQTNLDGKMIFWLGQRVSDPLE